ncbi:MAG: peptide chain release factor N(5)-glutamine methyltransferase [Gammaproteobacteria bacterium]|nr:peptide chain release factor N(5)-glutamine methyltransferase [Gammaproteobacteria bacterium]MCP4089548.1 peptide chain release factor N(5)-glutamine methyltransferase [Gammaproteobacteria bacterium]MCP4276254.1 peptide chain release factor N(5)-glutamine methyltransferase [Gammaproteobacteria bacterium]MCP4832951.1 peptide chain release factor N(5)-glutamine methyltransferase [Gammaproteobacteria bacterium]MCP4930076.1 peptide chain release factor N(5)-glutamine methyltransferase [Gammaprot
MTETLKSTLANAQKLLEATSDSPQLDAEILLGKVLQANRAALYANPEQLITDSQIDKFEQLLAQRFSGKPVAYLTGLREFWSLELKVTPDVLIPRPETELLVELSLMHIPESDDCKVLDLGCGSGAIAIAIATERPSCKLTATDTSLTALSIARENADKLCPKRIQFINGSWFAPLKGELFNFIISNPPYVSSQQPQLTDPELEHEPPQALYSGADGLDDLRQLVTEAPDYLMNNGYLLLEHGFDQADTMTELLRQAGFVNIKTHHDLAGLPRVTEAQHP